MRFAAIALIVVFFGFLFIVPGLCSIISISKVTIDPAGYEDQATHEWKGSFWVITATVDTTESFLLFNSTVATMSGLNSADGKTIYPTSTIKITISPRQPYWEIPLTAQSYMVYPKTYGTKFNTINRNALFTDAKIKDTYVPELDLSVLEPSVPYQCNLYTPIDIKVEKMGNDSFTQTAHIDTLGGTDTVVVSNPSDSSQKQKVMIQDLGKLFSGISTPSLNDMLIINNSTAFKKSGVIDAIKYGVDGTGRRVVDDCFAFYWFGGGKYTVNDGGPCLVERWDDDHSPNHLYQKVVAGPIATNCIVGPDSFPGSYRGPDEGPLLWPPGSYNQYAYPIAASIVGDNPTHNSKYQGSVWSLVGYLNHSFPESLLDLNYLQHGYTITSGNKLRIYAPIASSSSLITMKISSELVDSVVYQPIVGCGKCEQAYWDSSRTTSCSIRDKDVAVLKVKQNSPQSSKVTVTTSFSPNIPISVSPLMDSAIQDPGTVHDFQFQIRNLGTQTKQNGTITFTIKNDLGTVTDTQTLEFELLPSSSNTPEAIAGIPLWTWLVAVAAIAATSVAGYGFYRFRLKRGKSFAGAPPPSPQVKPLPTPSEPVRDGEVSRKRKSHRKILIASLILLVVFVSLGVYYYDAYHKLDVGLIGAGLGDVGYTSAEIRLTLEIRNPNLLPVYVPSGDFDITINDQRLGSGHFGSVTIGGNGRGSVEVRITFLLTDVPMVVIGLITGGGNVTIKVEGSANMLLFGIPFSSTLYNVKLT